MKYIVRETYKHGNARRVDEVVFDHILKAVRAWANWAEGALGAFGEDECEVIAWRNYSLYLKSGDTSTQIEIIMPNNLVIYEKKSNVK